MLVLWLVLMTSTPALAAERAPSDPGVELQLDIAEAMIDSGQANRALALLGELRESGVRGPQLDLAQARALRDVGMTSSAVTLMESVVRRRPWLAEAHHALGMLRMETRDVDDAVRRLRRAVQLERHRAQWQMELGSALLAAGRPAEAVATLERSVFLDASDSNAHIQLAIAHAASGEPGKAKEILASVEIGEADEVYFMGLGLELAGSADALSAFRRVLELRPDHPGAQAALGRLSPLDSPPDCVPAVSLRTLPLTAVTDRQAASCMED